MTFDLILSNIARHIKLQKEEINYFTSLLWEERVSKKFRIVEADQPCKYISFVSQGTVRAYHLDEDDKEATIMFAVADWWITDINAFTNKLPSILTIEAVEDSTVTHLSRDDFDILLAKIPKFEKFFRIIFQNAYVREQQRTIQNLSLPAHERYQNFLKKYPQVANQVTQKQVASYLGITPEFLSTLRKRK